MFTDFNFSIHYFLHMASTYNMADKEDSLQRRPHRAHDPDRTGNSHIPRRNNVPHRRARRDGNRARASSRGGNRGRLQSRGHGHAAGGLNDGRWEATGGGRSGDGCC